MLSSILGFNKSEIQRLNAINTGSVFSWFGEASDKGSGGCEGRDDGGESGGERGEQGVLISQKKMAK